MADKTLAFNIDILGVSNESQELAKIELQLRNIKKEKADLEKQARKGFASTEELQKLAAYNAQIKQHETHLKTLKSVANTANDSLARMRQELIRLKGEYAAASAAARDKMAPAINKLNQEISKAEQAIGVHSRGVGNYKEEILEAGKSLVGLSSVSALFMVVMNKLKEAWLSTTAGMDKFNISAQITKQLFYDLVTSGKINYENLERAAEAQKELNDIRRGDRADLVEFAKLEREIAILEFEAADKTKDRAVRQEALNKAIQKQNELSDKKLADIGEELDSNLKLLKGREDDEVLLNKIAELKAEIYNLDRERFEQSKRNEGRMTGFMEQEKKDHEAAVERWGKEIEAWNEKNAKLEKGTAEYAKMQDEIAKVIIAEAELSQRRLTNEEMLNTVKYKAPDGSIKNSEIEALQATQDEKDRIWAEGMQKARENFMQQKQDAQTSANDMREIDLAALDSKQAIVDAEIMITQGLSEAISEISGKNKTMTLAALAIEKSAAIAQIIANIAIANAKSIATFPITGGQPWVALNTGLGAISIAKVIAETVKSANEISGYATGGRIQGGLQLHGDKSRDNTLIYVKQNETVLTESQVARLGGSGAMRKAKVPGYAMGGYVGQQSPEIPSAGFDYGQLARLMSSIEIKLDVNKVNSAQKEISLITEPQVI